MWAWPSVKDFFWVLQKLFHFSPCHSCVLALTIKSSCYLKCCIFRPAFGCCTLQMLVETFIFLVFCAKKLKNSKSKKFAAKFSKKKVSTKMLIKGCLTQLSACENVVLTMKRFFSGNKTLNQHFGANLKKHFCKISLHIFLLFSSF